MFRPAPPHAVHGRDWYSVVVSVTYFPKRYTCLVTGTGTDFLPIPEQEEQFCLPDPPQVGHIFRLLSIENSLLNSPRRVCNNSSMMFTNKFVCFLLLLALVANASSCEPHVQIEIDDQVPPSFTFDGAGAIPFLMVSELPSGSSPDMTAGKVIWDIRPNDLAHARVPLGPIKYGTVPEGFRQLVPREGPPPPLQEGKTYEAGGPPIEMPNGYLRFTIQNGKAVKLQQ